MSLTLLLNNKGNNRNSRKSIELYGIIANTIATQLLENIGTKKIKIFDAK